MAKTKTELKKWGITDLSTSVIRKCGEDVTIQDWLTCSLLDKPCTIADLGEFNKRADGAWNCGKHFNVERIDSIHTLLIYGKNKTTQRICCDVIIMIKRDIIVPYMGQITCKI